MPTTPERLAALEAASRELDRHLSRLDDQVNGGPTVEFQQSVRGRLHSMQSAMASAEKVREAAEAAARASREATHTLETARGRRFSRLTQALLVACAVVTAAAPYVLHFTTWKG